MIEILSINQLNPGGIVGESNPLKNGQHNKTDSTNFSDVVENFIERVNESQIDAQEKVSDVIQGKSENLVEAMIALEEARLSFSLMLEIRNKLLESYQEIQRMQV